METRQFLPRSGLEAFIQKVVVVHYRFDSAILPPVNPFPPHPAHSLYFYPYDLVTRINPATGLFARLPPSVFVGPMIARVDLAMAHNTLVVIVLFQPGGMHRLMRIPMQELAGHAVDAALFDGSAIAEVTDRLREANDYGLMNAIVQEYLLQKAQTLKRILPIDEAIRYALGTNELLTVDRLASLAFVSTRQLERQFGERVGLSPKLFLRLVRFSRAWLIREHNPRVSWLHIAHVCEYTDQMHLIKDFKFFTGVTPGILQESLNQSPLRLQATSLIDQAKMSRPY